MSDASRSPLDEADDSLDQSDGDSATVPDTQAGDHQGVETNAVGEYTWADFMEEYGYGDEVEEAYQTVREQQDSLESQGFFSRWSGQGEEPQTVPNADDWASVSFDPATWLGFPPGETEARLTESARRADRLSDAYVDWIESTPVVKDKYGWEHYKWEYHYEDGDFPTDKDGEQIPFDREEALGFDPETIENRLALGAQQAQDLIDVEGERTVNVNPAIDEDEFFSTSEGETTMVNRYDLEKAVPTSHKLHFVEVERYWVNKPYAFVIIFHSMRENEKKYYLVGPHLTDIEEDLMEFFSAKLRTVIKYSDDDVMHSGESDRAKLLERETRRLLDRYDLYDEALTVQSRLRQEFESTWADAAEADRATSSVLLGQAAGLVSGDRPLSERVRNGANILFDKDRSLEDRLFDVMGIDPLSVGSAGELDGLSARPEPAILAEDPGTLTEYQVHKILHLLKRNFLGYERIDGIKHDINVEDISCDGYASPVFVYHQDYEQIITNVAHGRDELDDFVVKLAQRAGKGISKRRPQVDATLRDGSRAQLTLGSAVSGHGTNYTIRQFKEIPFTPVDLVNWNTFALDQMAFLWLCIENDRSLIFAGGTASGKTTSLNAVSLFIPNSTKIVSIEDTREVELPQRNWIASITRPSFGTSDKGDVDEFDLLEAALRQRPDYIVMGEVRGEEGRTLFQVMSTGHVTLTTFHADTVGEVLKRFTTDPINVSKTLFTSLDLVSVQTATRVEGRKVRRNKVLTEVNHYDPENDEINVQDVFQWEPEGDDYRAMGQSNTLEEIKFDRGWDQETLEQKLFERRVVLAYLIKHELNTYAEVAATLQAFANHPDTVLTLMAKGVLGDQLAELRNMESVEINVEPEKEALVPRPKPSQETLALAERILEAAEEELFDQYRDRDPVSFLQALADIDAVEDITAQPGGRSRLDAILEQAFVRFDGKSDGDADEEPKSAERGTGHDQATNGADIDEGTDGHHDSEEVLPQVVDDGEVPDVESADDGESGDGPNADEGGTGAVSDGGSIDGGSSDGSTDDEETESVNDGGTSDEPTADEDPGAASDGENVGDGEIDAPADEMDAPADEMDAPADETDVAENEDGGGTGDGATRSDDQPEGDR